MQIWIREKLHEGRNPQTILPFDIYYMYTMYSPHDAD